MLRVKKPPCSHSKKKRYGTTCRGEILKFLNHFYTRVSRISLIVSLFRANDEKTRERENVSFYSRLYFARALTFLSLTRVIIRGNVTDRFNSSKPSLKEKCCCQVGKTSL